MEELRYFRLTRQAGSHRPWSKRLAHFTSLLFLQRAGTIFVSGHMALFGDLGQYRG